MKTLIVIMGLLGLMACTDAVHLRHVATGKVAQCGPYSMTRFSDAMIAAERERGCVMDYQRQGYERVMR